MARSFGVIDSISTIRRVSSKTCMQKVSAPPDIQVRKERRKNFPVVKRSYRIAKGFSKPCISVLKKFAPPVDLALLPSTREYRNEHEQRRSFQIRARATPSSVVGTYRTESDAGAGCARQPSRRRSH